VIGDCIKWHEIRLYSLARKELETFRVDLIDIAFMNSLFFVSGSYILLDHNSPDS